jgi:DNA-binding NtrC family response regulator
VVDSDPQVEQEISALLSVRAVSEVHGFLSLDEAREYIRTNRTNLLIVPFDAPGGDGLDFLDEVRAHDPLIHVIITSDEPTLGQAVLSLQHGAVDFVAKPFDPLHELVEAVNLSIVRWRRWSEVIQKVAGRTVRLNS